MGGRRKKELGMVMACAPGVGKPRRLPCIDFGSAKKIARSLGALNQTLTAMMMTLTMLRTLGASAAMLLTIPVGMMGRVVVIFGVPACRWL